MFKNKKTGLSVTLAALLCLSQNVSANDASEIEMLKKEIAELRQMTKALLNQTNTLKDDTKKSTEKIAVIEEKQQILVDETSNSQIGFTTFDSTKAFDGMGAAASKVYYSDSPLSFGGYGKIDYVYESREGQTNRDLLDVYRYIGYIGYKFTDDIILNTEIEFEHGGAEDGATGRDGYVIIEFLYLDFLFNDNFNLRAGNMLVPMGLVNMRHEPTVFTTVQRPNTSNKLIPSTWHENGIMAHGQISENLSYNLGAFSALQLDRGAGQGNDWLRESRVGSFRNGKDERLGLAGVGRIDYTGIEGLYTGASVYVDSNLVIADVHFDYTKDAFRTYGVYTQTSRSEKVVGEPEKAKGGFINVGYDMLSFTQSDNKMPVFVQYETVSAQDKITGGTGKDSTDTITVGVNYFPTEQVVLKADYAMSKDNSAASNVDENNKFSLSMGFVF